mgnify:FL=1
MWKSPRRWLRVFAYTLAILLVLVAAAAGWLLYDLRSQMHSAVEVAGPGGIRAFSEATPEASPTTGERLTARPLDLNQLAHPVAAARPWTRWWWPGGDVTAQAACKQLEELHAVGFGGVEIQPFNAGLSEIADEETRSRINSFGDDQWFLTLGQVLHCAERLEMVVYLNHLSGWPAGGPQVAVDDGLWTLRHGETVVKGGAALELELPVPTPAVNDYLMALAEFFIDMELSDFLTERRELVAVVAAKITGGERTSNPLDATDTLQLDPDSVQVLTEQVVDGELQWQAPAGDWVIIATYLMPSGEAPTLVAAEYPGYVIDHLDADKIRAHYDYAYGRRTGLDEHYSDALAGFFNDSLEFKLDRLAARDIMPAFSERRGYDLTPHIPAVFVDAKDNFFIRDVGRTRSAPSFRLDDNDERVRYDYQLTLSDLIIERFAEASTDWAQARGLLSRAQTYGFELDTIRALGANHIPETEHLWGNSSEYTMKLAGAAGLLYERPLVSAESFVWAKRAYAVTPRHIKAGADLLFLSGVNQVIYHGIPYVTEGSAYQDTFGWLGWYPFMGPGNPSGFAGNYGPSTPIWSALPELNSYIARSQGILQTGRPDVDVLVYYPYLGFPKTIEDSEIADDALLFAGLLPGDWPTAREGSTEIPLVKFLPREKDPRLRWLENLIPTLRALDARGITWSWVNGHALETGRVNAADVDALLVADVTAMPLAAANAMASLAKTGVEVYFLGALPIRQPGYLNHVAGDQAVAKVARSAAQGRIVADAAQLAERIQPTLALSGAPAIRRVSRRGVAGTMSHLLVNRSLETVSGTLTPTAENPTRYAYWFDADSGAIWPAVPSAMGAYAISLGPLESRFLLFTNQVVEALNTPLSVVREDAALALELDEKWTLTIGGAVQTIEPPFKLVTKLPYADGAPVELVYETAFTWAQESDAVRALLDLGTVSGVAYLELNGEQFAPRSFDPFLFDVSDVLQRGENHLRLRIVPPLRNSLVGAEDMLQKELAQFSEQLGEVGLGGPVTIATLVSDETDLLIPLQPLPAADPVSPNQSK